MRETQKRKLQSLGGSLFISLPQEWISTYHLKKGTDIYITKSEGGQLVLSPAIIPEKEKDTHIIDYTDLFYRDVIREYLAGTDIITIKNDKGFTREQRESINNAVKNLMNCEIVDETMKSISIQCFKTDDTQIQTLIKRMYFITQSMFSDILNEKTNVKLIESIIDRDKQVGKFYFNILRQIRLILKGSVMHKEVNYIDLMNMRIIVERIEQIGDVIKQIIIEKKRNCQELAKLSELYKKAFNAYIEQNVESAGEFWKNEKEYRTGLCGYNLIKLYDCIKDIADLII